MASFHAKIGWKRRRNRENKNCRYIPFRSYMTRNRKYQKNRKKILNIKKCHYGFISSQNGTRQAENDTKKKLLFRSVPTRPGM